MNTTNTNRLELISRIILEIKAMMRREYGAMEHVLDALSDMIDDAEEPTKAAPAHPDTLTTEEDYENAPGGTIVAGYRALPACLWNDGKWALWTERASHRGMSGTTRRVLRWGWGE